MNFNISIFFLAILCCGWIIMLLLSNSILFDIKIIAVAMIWFKFMEIAIKLGNTDE